MPRMFHILLGALAAVLYLYLDWKFFDDYILHFANSLILLSYTSFLLTIWKPKLKFCYWLMVLSTGLLFGMLFMRQYCA